MARDRIKGITVEIGGDTTKLNKALRNTDINLSRVQGDLREVERLLKLDPTNVELLAQKQRLLAERSELAAERLNTMEAAAGQLDDTLGKSKLDDFNLELDLTRAKAENAARELADFDPALAQVGDSAGDAAGGLDDVGDSASGLKGGFDTASGAIATFAGNAMSMLLDLALQAAEAIWNLDEATEEYRESMAMLNTAFETAGFSQEAATEAYRGFYRVLGETDTATEASQLLAQLATSSEDISKWVDIAAGVYGRFGDSIPTEGLIEAANETAKTGKVTGVLADALNWVGISEDYVNEKLSEFADTTSRTQYLTALLSSTYQDAADTFYKNNESIIAANEAQLDMQDTTAVLGESIGNLKTKLMDAFGPAIIAVVNALATAIEAISPILEIIATVIGTIIEAVATLVGWIWEANDGFLALFGIGGKSKTAPSTPGGSASSGVRNTQEPRIAGLYNVLYGGPADIPALAFGGVVPPNDPFLAVLGDNKRETEIVAPYSAIKQAAGDAFDERGGASRAGGTAIAYLYLDGVKVGRAVYPYIQGETTRLGTKLVGGRR